MGDQEPDLSHIHWSSPEWIFHLPQRALTTADEALDYFALSPFWDVRSNNHALRTQRRVFDPTYGAAQERLDLLSFHGGFEYVISHSRAPKLFLVQKREVTPDGRRDKVTGMFWINDGKIFASPTLFDIFNNRIRNASFMLSETFQPLAGSRPSSNPRVPSSWRSLPPEDTQASSSKLPTISAAQQTSDDVTMTEEAETTDNANTEPTGPDIQLFNGLQMTRSSLKDLEKMSKEPKKEVAPMELKKMDDAASSSSKTTREGIGTARLAGEGAGASTYAGSPATFQAPASIVGSTPRPMVGMT